MNLELYYYHHRIIRLVSKQRLHHQRVRQLDQGLILRALINDRMG